MRNDVEAIPRGNEARDLLIDLALDLLFLPRAHTFDVVFDARGRATLSMHVHRDREVRLRRLLIDDVEQERLLFVRDDRLHAS